MNSVTIGASEFTAFWIEPDQRKIALPDSPSIWSRPQRIGAVRQDMNRDTMFSVSHSMKMFGAMRSTDPIAGGQMLRLEQDRDDVADRDGQETGR